jgi:tetrahydromethanopterin S-methyltransferase subunit F
LSDFERDDMPTDVFERAPNLLEVKAGFADARDVAAANQQVVDEFPKQMGRIARNAGEEAGTKAARRTARWFGIGGLIAVLLVSLGINLAGLVIARNASETVADERVARISAEQQAQDDRDKTAANVAALQQANAELRERGQAPVATPGPYAPDSDTLVAATTARVLAACQVCSLEEISRLVAAAVAAQPSGPSTAQMAVAIAEYARANPDRFVGPKGDMGPRGETGAKGDAGVAGPKGDVGDPGRPPTAEEIRAATDAELAGNPDKYRGLPGRPPAGWTFTDGLGEAHSCSRDAGSPDDAATYTCD